MFVRLWPITAASNKTPHGTQPRERLGPAGEKENYLCGVVRLIFLVVDMKFEAKGTGEFVSCVCR